VKWQSRLQMTGNGHTGCMAAVGGQTETRERSETVDFATGPSYVMYSMIYERFPAHTRTYERCEEGQSELSTAQSHLGASG
jgi:hypothetical protein